MFKVYFVAFCPFGIDGLLRDEAVSSTSRVLVEFVHFALVYSVLLVVMVGDIAAIVSTVRRRKETDSCQIYVR